MALSVASQKIMAAYNNYKKQYNINSLGDPAIKAAQALSEKFGIATFDLKGKVNTIPLTRPYDPRINIGTGSTGLTSQSLNEYLAKLSPPKALVPTKTVVTTDGFVNQQPLDSKLVQGEYVLEERNISPSFSTTIQQYTPYIILGGIALLAITLIKK